MRRSVLFHKRHTCIPRSQTTSCPVMDSLPFARLYVLLTGIKFGSRCHPLLNCFRLLVKATTVFILVSLILCHVYTILFCDSDVTASVAFATIACLQLVSYLRVCCTSEDMAVTMTSILNELPFTSIKRIHSFVRHQFAMKLLSSSVLLLSVVVYFNYVGIVPEVTILVLGNRSPDPVSLTHVLVPYILFVLTVAQFTLMVQSYSVTLFSVLQLAHEVRHELFKEVIAGHPDHRFIKQRLQSFNDRMRAVNLESGILSFALLSIIFTGFSTGITFFVTNGSRLRDPPYFTLVTTVALNVRCLTLAFRVIQLGHKTQEVMNKAWILASDAVTIRTPADDMTSEYMESKKGLKFFLMNESPVPVKACDNIIINRSLILSFFNQLIPFTVMLFTTVREFERKLSYKSMTTS